MDKASKKKSVGNTQCGCTSRLEPVSEKWLRFSKEKINTPIIFPDYGKVSNKKQLLEKDLRL